MRYFEFGGREANCGWVFRVETESELAWRPYDFCPNCRANDLLLLSEGIASDTRLRIRAGADVVYTNEECLTLLSEKAKTYIEQEQIGGIGFIPLPNNPFFIAKPLLFVETKSTEIAHLRFVRRCNNCGIYAEAAGSLNSACFMPPTDDNLFFGLEGLNIGPRICELYCSETVAHKLKKAKLKGLELNELE